MVDRNETGNDGVLIVGDVEIPFTNCTGGRTTNTSSSKYNDRDTPYTGLNLYYFEGTFEWDGSIPDAEDALTNDDGSPVMDAEMIVRGSEGGWRYQEVSAQGNEWEYPADGKSTGSQDWRADVGRPI